MKEEEKEEWQVYNHVLLTQFPNGCVCNYCNKTFISDEFTIHLIYKHKKEAKATKNMIRERLDYEKDRSLITDKTIEGLQ